MTRVGLRIPAELDFDDWAHTGRRLSAMLDSSSWCLGDWLVFGMRNYADRYRHAVRTAGLRYQTLRNYAWVSRQFPLERRRARLSFQHHAEVAAMPPEIQDSWLDRAERYAWTTRQLRTHVQQERSGGAAAASDAVAIPRIRVTGSRMVRWRMAADRSGAEFGDWMLEALDRAAERELSTASPPDS
ncbi:LmbU family transcriptional regulator [Streptomyces sp. CAU 1734]|uniref:LmbU family transcriptional regulator n=1 Tax=Streptomyces sp. CAU 1734 TaxID=3140360 RepID=UPI0032612CFD